MSKQAKQLEMEALRKTFTNVRELVLLSVSGLSCQADNQLRAGLRKKNIRVQLVKNSLARRVFDDLGIKISADSPYWQGTTWMAWGPGSVAELSKELDRQVLRNAQLKGKVRVKGAIAEGNPVTFEMALTMPTRIEAIGAVLAAILGPASQIASQINGPASELAGQVKTLSERPAPEEAPAEAVAAAT
jgi:large subunit ribosomal protein L10